MLLSMKKRLNLKTKHKDNPYEESKLTTQKITDFAVETDDIFSSSIKLSTEEMVQLMLLHEQDLREKNNIDPTNPSVNINPDTMTYEQLLELEEKMGKVSKGLSAEQISVFSG